jgi:hypothetical protein
MAVPRPVLLALIGLGLLASVFLVTRSGTNESVTSSSKSAVKPAVAPNASPSGRKADAHKATRRAPATAKPATKPAGAQAPAVPAEVQAAANALAANKVVVILFSKPGGAADDVGARTAVRALRGTPRVEIFNASLDEVSAFRPMLSNLGISQIPSTVIVRPGKKAVLLQGFVDAGTLRQNVADALR